MSLSESSSALLSLSSSSKSIGQSGTYYDDHGDKNTMTTGLEEWRSQMRSSTIQGGRKNSTNNIQNNYNNHHQPTLANYNSMDQDDANNNRATTTKVLPLEWYPHFILGFSTGHSGSTFVHQALVEKGCPWNSNPRKKQYFFESFENIVNHEIKQWFEGSTKHRNTSNNNNRNNDDYRFIKSNQYDEESSDDDDDDENSPSCQFVQTTLLPKLLDDVQRHTVGGGRLESILPISTYLDLGHYHNRGHILECIAKTFWGKSKQHYQQRNKLTFIRIRRNRHAIAYSFAHNFDTPCLQPNHNNYNNNSINNRSGEYYNHNTTAVVDDYTTNVSSSLISSQPPQQSNNNISLRKPQVTTCPRSTEGIGNVALPIPNDIIWDSFTPFQKFLWYVDEIEYRWYLLFKQYSQQQQQQQPQKQKGYGDDHKRESTRPPTNASKTILTSSTFSTPQQHPQQQQQPPKFLEITWSTSLELEQGVQALRTSLGCTLLKTMPQNVKQHTSNSSKHDNDNGGRNDDKETFSQNSSSNSNSNRHNNNNQQPLPPNKQQKRLLLLLSLNCTDLMYQDWEYQNLMQYSTKTKQALLLSQSHHSPYCT